MSGSGFEGIKDVVIGFVAVAASFVASQDAVSVLTVFTLVCTAILLPMRVVHVALDLLKRFRPKPEERQGDE